MSKQTHTTKYILMFWIYTLSGMSLVVLLFCLISIGAFGRLPTFEELENPKNDLATEVYTSDKVLLGKYYHKNRSNASYEEISPYLKNALIATEDVRYEKHSGIDAKAILGVIKGMLTGSGRGGGSTISQQLAKNLFPRKRLNKIQLVIRKFKEWIIAARLEKAYTKNEIMTMYFNTVEFSDNAFGIKSAARTYFNKSVDKLTINEAATLVGMLKAPYKYNPRLHPKTSQKRRNVVLSQLYRYNYINKTLKDSLQKQAIVLNFKSSDHTSGLAPYFRENLRTFLKQWCQKNPKPDGSMYNIYTDGLKIYTTLDSRMQKHAEQAAKEHLSKIQKIFFKHWDKRDPWRKFPSEFKREYTHCSRYRNLVKQGLSKTEIDKVMHTPVEMKVFSWEGDIDTLMTPHDSIKYYRMFLQNGFLALDPKSGYIKAWVGGINYKHFKYDHVNIHTKRQIGSTFKPFVYTMAIAEKGYSPCYEIPNEPITFEKKSSKWSLLKDWTPKNADGKYGGSLSIVDGLKNSVNTITAYLMHEIGPQSVINLVRNMGITSEIGPYPSICLGTPDISLYEMMGAYTAYANKGIYTEPLFITHIEDKNGNIIHSFTNEKREVLNEETAHVILRMLKKVVDEGTGRRLRFRYGLHSEIAGKTGTTQNHSDGWFIGLTPQLIAGSWVGCEDRFVRFRNLRYGQGASTALPIWALFFKKVYADKAIGLDQKAKFYPPKDINKIELDCSKYNLKKENTEDIIYGQEYD